MGLREWLIVGGGLLVVLILLDGWRRISGRHNKIRMEIDPSMEGIGSENASHNPELPNGGARPKSDFDDMSPSEAISESNLNDNQLVDEATAELKAKLDEETALISGLRADRDSEDLLEAVMDDGSVLSKPRTVAYEPTLSLDPDEEPLSAPQQEKSKPDQANSTSLNKVSEQELSPEIDKPEVVTRTAQETNTPTLEDSIELDSTDFDDLANSPLSLDTEDVVVKADELDTEESLESIELDIDEVPTSDAAAQKRNAQHQVDAKPEVEAEIEMSIPDSESLELDDTPPNEVAITPQQNETKTDDKQGALGEIDDLFALTDLDFDRPIHELMDASAKSEPELPKAKKKSSNTSRSEAQTGSLFDELLEQVDEDKPLDDIESLVVESSELDVSESGGSSELSDDETIASNVQREPRELDFTDPELTLVILVVAKKGERFAGGAIRNIVEACGMEFGQLSLFHRYEDHSARSPIQFSMSDAVQPGSFELDQLDEYETPGLSLFMSLSEPRDPVYAFDCMLATAETLAKHLSAEMLDGDKSALRPQTKEHYRERIQNFLFKQRASKRRAH